MTMKPMKPWAAILARLGFDINLLRPFRTVFCLVSGGMDSTLLAEACMESFPDRTQLVNCYNPYESNRALGRLRRRFPVNFQEVRQGEVVDFKAILTTAFRKLPQAWEDRLRGKYHKKVFACCRIIKHKRFLRLPRFKEPGTCVVSGIRPGEGQQRWFWLRKLRKQGRWFHLHQTGQLYVYPFRDYGPRDLPADVVGALRQVYPDLKHSGCRLCPVLVLFNLQEEGARYEKSVEFARELGLRTEYPRRVTKKVREQEQSNP